MPLGDGIVVGVVTGSDLERPRAKLARDVIISDDRESRVPKSAPPLCAR